MTLIDHIIVASPDLDDGIAFVESRLGTCAVPGGQHPGWGTRNALLGLGTEAYLEIIAPDPEQPKPDHPCFFGMDDLRSPCLSTWVVRGNDLERAVALAEKHGLDLGAILEGGRRRPDGTRLSWRVTDPFADRAGGVVPFFIDWMGSPHPAESSPQAGSLMSLEAEHPDAARIQAVLSALQVRIPIVEGPGPRLIATIETPQGPVKLS